MKKIGILGGTFNPIHHGHLILGQAAKEEFGLDEILVMPTKNPAYKTISGGVSEQNRVDMIKLAIRDFPYFKFSDIELKREGTTYTVDTLRELTTGYRLQILLHHGSRFALSDRDMERSRTDFYHGRYISSYKK